MASEAPPGHDTPKPAPASRPAPSAAGPMRGRPADLQRRLGNRGVSGALRRSAAEPAAPDARTLAVQPKLTVGAPNDPLEREADQASAGLPGTAGAAGHGGSRPAAPGGTGGTGSLGARISSPGGGRPLPPAMRGDMERRLGADFSGVRVHDGAADRADADRLGARAFTHQRDIWLGGNGSVDDQGLMAHELTHVVQQTGGKQPDVQAHWYNFDIPFTDYQFDPSISGLETAAGVVKDAAVDSATWVKDQVVAGLEWLLDRVKDVVDAGVTWLEDKYTDIKGFAASAFDSINDGVRSLLERITSPAAMLTDAVKLMNGDLLSNAWGLLKSGVTLISQGIESVIDGVLGTGTKLWEVVSGFVTGLFDTLESILGSWAFGQLPEGVQSTAREFVAKVHRLWAEIRDFLTDLLRRLREYAGHVLDAIAGFTAEVTAAGIDAVLAAMRTIAETWEFVRTIAADPAAFARPYIDRLAATLNAEAPPKAIAFGGAKLREAATQGPAATEGPAVTVRRQPEPAGEERSVAGLDEVSAGFTEAVTTAWADLDISKMLWEALKSIFWPFPGIAREFHDLWTEDWTKAVSSFFTPRSPFGSWADFGGFWHDVWSNILVVLDFPLALLRRLVNVVMLLMGWITIALVALGAFVGFAFAGPPGALVGAEIGFDISVVAGAVLAEVYLATESTAFFKALLDLFTARQTEAEKERDYKQMAGSAIGIAAVVILELILFLLSSFVSAVIGAIKRFRPAPAVEAGGSVRPPEPKAAPPGAGEAPPRPGPEEPPAPGPGEKQPRPGPEEEPPNRNGERSREGLEDVTDEDVHLEDLDEPARQPGEPEFEPAICFPAGTLVATRAGPVPIELVEPGSLVHAYDFGHQEVVERAVLGRTRGSTTTWVDVRVTGGETVRATPRHQFWAESAQEWTPAGQLRPGMTVRLRDGATATVASVSEVMLEQPAATFNLSVAGAENYFVGSLEALVHNISKARMNRLSRLGFQNYVLRDVNDKIYYSGSCGPEVTIPQLELRHGANHDRFDAAAGDWVDMRPGTRECGQARLLEQRVAVRNRTIIGRDGQNYRGNRQNPIDPANMPEYREYEIKRQNCG